MRVDENSLWWIILEEEQPYIGVIKHLGRQAGEDEKQLGMPAHLPLPQNLSFPQAKRSN